jgi:hypothetical protein
MNKPGIFAAIAVVIIGAIAIIWAASKPYAPSFGAQIEPLPMMAHTQDLPVQQIADFSVVFVEPVPPTAVALEGASGEEDVTRRALLDRR